MLFSTNKKSFKSVFFIVLLYRITLDIIYIYGIYPYYDYLYNFKYSYSIERFFYSYLLIIPFGYVIYKYTDKRDISSLFILALTMVYFLPGTSIYCWDGLSFVYFVFYLLFFLLLVLYNKILPHYKFVRKRKSGKNFINRLAIIIAVINALFIVYFHGFNLTLDFSDIYDMREDWSSTNIPTIMAYFQPFAARFIPILIVYFVCKKKYFYVLLLFISQLLSFSFGGMKYTFFALIISLLVGFFYSNFKRIIILYGLLGINILSILELFLLQRESFIITFLTRRLSYVPNKISYYYYEFFCRNELLYLRESFLRWFGFENPYNKRIPALIGDYAFGRTMGANTGMFGEAYSQFGWLSTFIYPLFYILAFRLLEASYTIRNKVDYKMIFTTVILFTISFIDGSFFSILLTQGFLLTCLLLYFMSNAKK